MSKKQRTAAAISFQLHLALTCAMLLFPATLPAGPIPAFVWLTALAALALSEAAHLLWNAWMRRHPALWAIVLLPLVLPRIDPSWPAAAEIGLRLFPLLLLLKSAALPLPLRLGAAAWGSITLGGWLGLTDGPLAEALPPNFPYLLLLLALPALLCLRIPWRPLLLPPARLSTLMLIPALLIPPYFRWIPTAFQSPAELEIRDPGAAPAPRFRLLPDATPENVLPDGFTPELVQFLFDRQLAQSDVALLQLFTGAPIEPAEMIRAMRIHGFLLSDPVGNHVPPEAFRIDPTVNMSEDYVIWVDRFLEHVTVSPEVIGEELFRQAMRQRVLIQARPGLQRFRLSADKRGALENGLHPRQILTLLSPEAPQLTGEAYARRWQLPLAAAEAELTALVEAGFLEARRWELETVAPPQFVPAEGVTSRIFIRLLFIVMALLWLQRILPDRRWPALGILLWTGFAATEISQTATTLPSAAATGLWLTLPVLLVLILTLKTIRPDLAAAAAAPAETDPHSAPHSPSATPPAP